MKKLLHSNNEGSAQAIGVVIAGLVAIIIGVLVWYRINGAINTAALGAHGDTGHAAIGVAFNSTNTSANTIWTLFPIVSIVIVAGVILAIVMGFGRAQA